MASLTATIIICHCIHTKTANQVQDRRRYRHIIDILIQSSVLYTVVTIGTTIDSFLATGDLASSMDVFLVNEYFEALTLVISVIFL